MIPNIIHFIFFLKESDGPGFEDFEYIHYLSIKSAKHTHNPEKIFLYYNHTPKNNHLWDEIVEFVELIQITLPEAFNGVRLESFQYKADILRLQTLIKHGGIYLDLDTVSLKPFGNLLNQRCVLGIESGGDTLETAESISNAVILTEPNHPFIMDWLEQTGKNLEGKHWAYHAVNLPVEILKAENYDVHLEPKQSFIPFDWRDKWIWSSVSIEKLSTSYIIHMWETIWKDELKLVSNNYLKKSDSLFAKVCKKYINEKKLKIAIYTICKNEQDFVNRWAASNSEADIRLICDTGSTDNTVEKLKQLNVTVYPITVSPWRFDTARNTALNLLPADIDLCIWQDLDEELLPGWRKALEEKYETDITTYNHRYRHNDSPWQWHGKIHARHGCIWRGAVHESLKWFVPEKDVYIDDFYLDEHQNKAKPRTSYLPLLLKKVEEGDKNWRTYIFLSNEYVNDFEKNLNAKFKAYEYCDEDELSLSYIARLIGDHYEFNGDAEDAKHWYQKSLNHSKERETYHRLAKLHYKLQDWTMCFTYSHTGIGVTKRRNGFTFDINAWNHELYDYAALSSYHLGLKQKAVEYGKIAIEHSDDPRLLKNLEFYEKS